MHKKPFVTLGILFVVVTNAQTHKRNCLARQLKKNNYNIAVATKLLLANHLCK